ncbi:MAG: shikimate kinase [Pyrinomonadaceae bacterium]
MPRSKTDAAEKRIALTGFMGVGKTSVARHLANLLKCGRLDLDSLIEQNEHRRIAEIIDRDGIEAYRRIETANLKLAVNDNHTRVLSLGGGTWTIAENRDIIRRSGLVSLWLDASFHHCWANISRSRKERPLARDKNAARTLFDERQEVYCLADWHFVVRPEFTSYEIAGQIMEQVFS